MTRAAAIEKGKEVEIMKRAVTRVFTTITACLVLAVTSLPTLSAEPRPLTIVVLGDSLTAGLGLPQEASFPAQLETALKARGRKVAVINAGVSGDTAAAALKRLDWALPENTGAVIVELGGNDALQGLPPAETKAVLAKIIEKLQAKGLLVLLAGMEAPRNMGKEYVDDFAAIFPELATRYDILLYPFFLDGVALDGGLMQADGIHPNDKGVARIVEGILPKVEALIAEVEAKE
jgi:acyl-CoA thioesterase I